MQSECFFSLPSSCESMISASRADFGRMVLHDDDELQSEGGIEKRGFKIASSLN